MKDPSELVDRIRVLYCEYKPAMAWFESKQLIEDDRREAKLEVLRDIVASAGAWASHGRWRHPDEAIATIVRKRIAELEKGSPDAAD